MEDPAEQSEPSTSKIKKNKPAATANKPQPEKKMKKTRKSRKPVKNKAGGYSESSDHEDNDKVDFNALSVSHLHYRLII
jgi:hypothetical protein